MHRLNREHTNRVTPTIMQKVQQKQQARQAETYFRNQEIIEHNRKLKRELIATFVLVPVILVLAYFAFVLIWASTPQLWW